MGIGFFISILDNVGHFKRDDHLKLTGWAWLQADRAHICIRVVEVVACETPPTLRDRRVQCRNHGQPHVGRTCSLVGRCIAEVILDPVSLRGRKLCPHAVRYDQSSFGTIVDVLILVQIRSNGVIEVQSRRASLSAPHTRTLFTAAILGGGIFALLVYRHIWLESGAGKFCSRSDHMTLWVCGWNCPLIVHLNFPCRDAEEV